MFDGIDAPTANAFDGSSTNGANVMSRAFAGDCGNRVRMKEGRLGGLSEARGGIAAWREEGNEVAARKKQKNNFPVQLELSQHGR